MIEISHRGTISRYTTLERYIHDERQGSYIGEDYDIYNDRLTRAKSYEELFAIVGIVFHVFVLITFGITLLASVGDISHLAEFLSVVSLLFLIMFTLSSHYYLNYYCERTLNRLAVAKGLERFIYSQDKEIKELKKEIQRLNEETIPAIKESSSSLLPKKNDRWTDMDIVSLTD